MHARMIARRWSRTANDFSGEQQQQHENNYFKMIAFSGEVLTKRRFWFASVLPASTAAEKHPSGPGFGGQTLAWNLKQATAILRPSNSESVFHHLHLDLRNKRRLN